MSDPKSKAERLAKAKKALRAARKNLASCERAERAAWEAWEARLEAYSQTLKAEGEVSAIEAEP